MKFWGHTCTIWVSEVKFTAIYRQFNYLEDEVLRSAGCWTTLTWCGSDWVGIRFDGFWVSRELRLSLCSSQRLPDQRCSNHQLWMERENRHDILLNDREAVISHLQDISVITDDNHFLINNFTYTLKKIRVILFTVQVISWLTGACSWLRPCPFRSCFWSNSIFFILLFTMLK